MFNERSRYAHQPVKERLLPDGRRAAYVLPRLTPPPESMQVGARLIVTDSDRIDGLAYRQLGTPEGWWWIADANRAMHPDAVLAEPGREITIPLPGTTIES